MKDIAAVFTFIVGSLGILWGVGGVIIVTHHSNRFRETIIRPWQEAIVRHDWQSCEIYRAAGDASNADYDQILNPLRWKELWSKKYITDKPKAITELIQ